jgi:FixJ family two-component response regulator
MNETPQPTIHVIDDDVAVRNSLVYLFDSAGWKAETYKSGQAFLDAYDGSTPGCLILDVRMPLMSGMELQQVLKSREICLPVIFLSGHADLPMAVQAMKNGAFDFLEKPCNDHILLDAVNRAVRHSLDTCVSRRQARALHQLLGTLTAREREVAERLAEGGCNKSIARELGISEKTVQVHRHNTMEKLGVRSTAEIARLMMESRRAPP